MGSSSIVLDDQFMESYRMSARYIQLRVVSPEVEAALADYFPKMQGVVTRIVKDGATVDGRSPGSLTVSCIERFVNHTYSLRAVIDAGGFQENAAVRDVVAAADVALSGDLLPYLLDFIRQRPFWEEPNRLRLCRCLWLLWIKEQPEAILEMVIYVHNCMSSPQRSEPVDFEALPNYVIPRNPDISVHRAASMQGLNGWASLFLMLADPNANKIALLDTFLDEMSRIPDFTDYFQHSAIALGSLPKSMNQFAAVALDLLTGPYSPEKKLETYLRLSALFASMTKASQGFKSQYGIIGTGIYVAPPPSLAEVVSLRITKLNELILEVLSSPGLAEFYDRLHTESKAVFEMYISILPSKKSIFTASPNPGWMVENANDAVGELKTALLSLFEASRYNNLCKRLQGISDGDETEVQDVSLRSDGKYVVIVDSIPKDAYADIVLADGRPSKVPVIFSDTLGVSEPLDIPDGAQTITFRGQEYRIGNEVV